MKIKIKLLSVNKCWQGRRFKTEAYKDYEKDLLRILPKLKIPQGKLKVYYEFGLSNKNADADNIIKPLQDILQQAYNFNDKNIYKMEIEKVDVKKGQEYLSFIIESLNENNNCGEPVHNIKIKQEKKRKLFCVKHEMYKEDCKYWQKQGMLGNCGLLYNSFYPQLK